MDVLIHKQIDTIESIFPDWKTLKEEYNDITVFQDINWIKSWWSYKSKQTNISPYVIEIKEGNETIAIIALYCSIIRFSIFKFRVLRPIGADLSDYLVPILSKKYSSEMLLKLAFEKIYEDKKCWDYLEWGEVPEDSSLAHFLNNHLIRKDNLIKSYRGEVCPYLILEGDIEGTNQKLDPKFLKELLKKERKLKKSGELIYTKVSIESDIEPIMNKFFELHCDRWNNTDTPSIYRNQVERANAMQIAKNLFNSKLLDLTYLSINNEIIAVNFGMADGKRNYLYTHSMDMEYKKYSPAHLITYYLILDACKEGYEIIDFLRGNEDYKQKWGTIDKYNLKFELSNKSLRSMLYKSIFHTNFVNHVLVSNLKSLVKRFVFKKTVG